MAACEALERVDGAVDRVVCDEWDVKLVCRQCAVGGVDDRVEVDCLHDGGVEVFDMPVRAREVQDDE